MTTSSKGFKIGFRYLSFFELSPVTALTLDISTLAYTSKTVTFTSVGHSLQNGDTIVVAGVNSGATMQNIDGTWTVTNRAANTFDFVVTGTISGTTPQTIAIDDAVTKTIALELPKATSATVPYEGLHYESARAMTINYPQPRKIEHQGDDRVEALDFLPPATAMDAEVHLGMSNLDIIAALSGIKVNASVGTSNFLSLATDQQGLEPFVSILAYSQAQDWPLGNRTWQWYFYPYARAIYAPSSLAETPQDIIFRVAPQFTSQLPWGLSLTAADNGTLTHQGMQGISMGRPHLACWKAGVSTTAYLFDASHPAYSTSSIAVYVNGRAVTPSPVAVTGFTIPAPEPNDIVCAWYEE